MLVMLDASESDRHELTVSELFSRTFGVRSDGIDELTASELLETVSDSAPEYSLYRNLRTENLLTEIQDELVTRQRWVEQKRLELEHSAEKLNAIRSENFFPPSTALHSERSDSSIEQEFNSTVRLFDPSDLKWRPMDEHYTLAHLVRRARTRQQEKLEKKLTDSDVDSQRKADIRKEINEIESWIIRHDKWTQSVCDEENSEVWRWTATYSLEDEYQAGLNKMQISIENHAALKNLIKNAKTNVRNIVKKGEPHPFQLQVYEALLRYLQDRSINTSVETGKRSDTAPLKELRDFIKAEIKAGKFPESPYPNGEGFESSTLQGILRKFPGEFMQFSKREYGLTEEIRKKLSSILNRPDPVSLKNVCNELMSSGVQLPHNQHGRGAEGDLMKLVRVIFMLHHIEDLDVQCDIRFENPELEPFVYSAPLE